MSIAYGGATLSCPDITLRARILSCLLDWHLAGVRLPLPLAWLEDVAEAAYHERDRRCGRISLADLEPTR